MSRGKADVGEVPFELTRYLNVAGILHGDRLEVAAGLSGGDTLWLNREPANPHDRNAIAVIAEAGQLGYLTADHAKMLAPLMDAGRKVAAHVIEIREYETNSGGQALGVSVLLDFDAAADGAIDQVTTLDEEVSPGGEAMPKRRWARRLRRG